MTSNYKIIFRRLRSFVFVLIDIILIFLIFYFSNSKFYISFYETLIIFLWIIISYFIGRYYLKSKSYKNNLLKTFNYSVLMFILCNLTTSIISFLIEKIFLISTDDFYINVNSLVLLFIYSIISNFLISIYNKENFKNFGTWIVIENNDSIFKDKNLFLNFDFKGKFIHYDNLDYFDNYLINISGIIISDNLKINLNKNTKLLNYQKINLPIYTYKSWCKEFIFRYPPEIFIKDNLLSIDIFKIKNSLESRLKRSFDVLVSLILLLIFSPLIIISCILIKVEDHGPVFYSQKRSGYLGREFIIWKIRTMQVNSEPNGPVWSSKNDKRNLKVGSILRSLRIDELPQLLNVIKGEMSLIGPRPERPEIEIELVKKIPNYMVRYQAKPGLSGWAQVNYPYGSSLKDAKNKLSYDLFYILNYSIFLDIIIFVKTIRTVINANNSKPVN